ncbi:MAG TPA: hypothetical protein VEB21_00270 [Terriglobales bacterium]|nr:hypothetical protein [Terriglobales bacterium]
MHRLPLLSAVAFAALLALPSSSPAQDCEQEFPSTFELIQAAIFEPRGCTSTICHGGTPSPTTGNLDLRPENAYDSLIDVASHSVPGMRRVQAGQARESLLWLNLAAKTFPLEYEAPLRPMPLDPVPALSESELEAVRLWIEKGAPRTGVVPGTGELLDACLPPPEPIEIKPLDPPPAGTGIQLRMPRWTLPAVSEDEICHVTYYDVTDQVPEQYRGNGGTTFRYNFHETRQDPLSHHLVPVLYEGAATDPHDPAWGVWKCRGGARHDEVCDPVDLGFCGEGVCGSPIVSTVGCLGYGPGDDGIGFTSAGISVTQETANEFPVPDGVYEELPLKGIIMWSSHAFNLTAKEGKIESWVNFHFAAPQHQQTLANNLFAADQIFAMDVPPFQTQEVCNIRKFEENTHVFEWGAHTHKRGKRFRTFMGAFRCEGGSNDGQPCSPIGSEPAADICQGAPCTAYTQVHVGDCDGSRAVTVDEVITGVNIALGAMDREECLDIDADRDYSVTVDEVITSITAALEGVPAPEPADGQESMFYLSMIYNDPTIIRPEEPFIFRGTDDERSVTFCALYDNGYTDPDEVKLRSASPPPPISVGGIGGPCSLNETRCSEGKRGESCTGRTQANRDRSCDSSEGAADGICDACPLEGGVTTEDEMFILLGRFYVP